MKEKFKNLKNNLKRNINLWDNGQNLIHLW